MKFSIQILPRKWVSDSNGINTKYWKENQEAEYLKHIRSLSWCVQTLLHHWLWTVLVSLETWIKFKIIVFGVVSWSWRQQISLKNWTHLQNCIVC